MKLSIFFLLVASLASSVLEAQPKLLSTTVNLAGGKKITLSLAESYAIDVSLEGLRRVRFLTRSPDGRIFATDMYSLADNHRGTVYILDGWNKESHRFARAIPYLSGLHNPNNVVFWTDPQGQSWMYIGLTDELVRYRYNKGDLRPADKPEVLASFPAYGLSYKYGGWHLTRSVAVATLHGRPTLYVTVGSSCNACREREAIRATVSAMEMDGSNARVIGHGLRNAVGMVVVPDGAAFPGGALLATNMGADHLGDELPEDPLFVLDSWAGNFENRDYGWPTCFFAGGVAYADRLIADPKAGDHVVPAPPTGPPPMQADCKTVPAPVATFRAHSSPLGIAWFDSSSGFLAGSFLVALHGAGKPRIGAGYKVVRVSPEHQTPEDFLTGFHIRNGETPIVVGRPCGLLAVEGGSFLMTDDKSGIVYFIHPRKDGSRAEQKSSGR